MAEDEKLRSLIRLIPAARALKEQLEKSIHLEIYSGTGDAALKSLQGLQRSISEITGDSYVASLSLEAPQNATDKEKVSLALLIAIQLSAYLEGQTGLVDLSGKSAAQYAPNINIQNVKGLGPDQIDKIMKITEDTLHGESGKNQGKQR